MPRSSPDVPPTQIQVGFGDRVGIGMKGQYTPKIGDEFEIVAIEVVEASSPTPETIREYTRAAIALLTVVATAVVLLIAWIYGLTSGDYIPLTIATLTMIPLTGFILAWYFGKTDFGKEHHKDGHD